MGLTTKYLQYDGYFFYVFWEHYETTFLKNYFSHFDMDCMEKDDC